MPRHANPEAKSKIESSRLTLQKDKAVVEHRHHATVYDAVAGRVTAEGFIPIQFSTSRYTDISSRSNKPIPPERALFRLKGRDFDGDNDPYWADRRLTADQQLPDSDLLKAVHAYASDFYHKNLGDGAIGDYKSLDETALLCCGMLLEEMADEVLGETGDLALTEGEVVIPEARTRGVEATDRDGNKSTGATVVVEEPKAMADASGRDSPVQRKSKRRKINHKTVDG